MRARRFRWWAAAAGAVVAALPAVPAQAIVGGYPQDPGQYPYFVRFDGPERCGGAVIAPDVVLTAAHCVDGGTTPAQVRMFVSDSIPTGAVSIRVHPLWNGDLADGHDLAVVRTTPGGTAGVTPVQVGAPFSTGAGAYEAGTPATVLGRGRTAPGRAPAIQLMGIDTVIRSDGYMDDIYNPAYWFDSWNSALMIGAGDSAHTVCYGDSGSPLMSFPGGRPVLVGVASFVETWPDECGEPGGFAELSGPQLAWLATEVPTLVDRWGGCVASNGGLGYADPVYTLTAAASADAQRDGDFFWWIRCASQPDRLGPSIAVGQTGGWLIAFQANTCALWTRGSWGGAGAVPGAPAVAPGTSPGVVWVPGGGWRIVYQAASGMLHTSSPWGEVVNLGLGLAPGTSPSIAIAPSGAWLIAFQANTGVLWTRSSSGTGGPVPGNPTMAPGTSPSVATLPSGGFQIAYQASNGMLHTALPTGAVTSLGLGMASGTSPSLAVAPSGAWMIAFRANTGVLWTRLWSGSATAWPATVRVRTSPSVTALASGGFQVTYQGDDGTLRTIFPSGEVVSFGFGMSPGSSPAVAAKPGSGWITAFEADGGLLWNMTSAGFYENLGLGMPI